MGLQDFISYKNYRAGTDEDVFYGVCLTPNTDYIKIEIDNTRYIELFKGCS